MSLTRTTYTQGTGQRHEDVLISPTTLADGTLFMRLDRQAYPQKGVKFAGVVGQVLAAPVLTLGTVSTTLGTFAAATYFWKITALDQYGSEVLSNQITTAVLLNGRVAMSWAAVPGAVSYNVYRGTVTNTQNKLITSTTALSYIDTGTAGTTLVPPATNTTGVIVPPPARTTHGVNS